MRKIYGNYITQKRLGSGSFGEVWEAVSHSTGQKVALKLEPRNSSVPQLFFEAKLYSMFQASKSTNNSVEPCNNIPVVYATGQTETTNYMAMELLGKSLEDLVSSVPRFSQKTILMLAGQMISCVEFVHKHNFIHRDIKPDNFAMGVSENSNKIYIIDFGLSKKYIDQNNRHIRNCTGKSLTGTARYASINALEGKEQSRRDDMESLLYVWVYLLHGRLPWMSLPTTGRKKYGAILMKKRSTKPEELCLGLNSFFVNYLIAVRSLKFEEEPNYAMYRKMIYDAMIADQIPFDYRYDWVKTRIVRPQRENQSQLSNVKKENVQTQLSLMVSPPSKDILRTDKYKAPVSSRDVIKDSSSSTSKDILQSSTLDESSQDKKPIKAVESNQKPYTPPRTINTTETRMRSKTTINTARTTAKNSSAVKKESSATRTVKKETHPATTKTTKTVNRQLNSSTTKPATTSSHKDSEPASSRRTSPLRSSRRQNDGIRPAKERTALFTATASKPPVSYRTGMLPKWMMAPLTSRR
ncbi:CK1 family protein kinase [Trichomonas vaginalis G3]|uniref:CK1 family protein kinase n=1 Tax=Trichomonas vaginalis (strain ATCC PRA-98 / G3) TaxID=412133 RepID=A2DV32_TRIV3|nr:STKc CK1 domain-containing protein [Trichomonas vaginalis G3]EAY15759.1 CK1 family protein kinase [Trichomonas vaginalis G3]KAI5486533.1 STKc CK1 domain-containing protein [Trichomonas vaginalis G3]|eukprot:XP_001327982.1 CK1 family protein kinase [Trichomonas vaginalis G3]